MDDPGKNNEMCVDQLPSTSNFQTPLVLTPMKPVQNSTINCEPSNVSKIKRIYITISKYVSRKMTFDTQKRVYDEFYF